MEYTVRPRPCCLDQHSSSPDRGERSSCTRFTFNRLIPPGPAHTAPSPWCCHNGNEMNCKLPKHLSLHVALSLRCKNVKRFMMYAFIQNGCTWPDVRKHPLLLHHVISVFNVQIHLLTLTQIVCTAAQHNHIVLLLLCSAPGMNRVQVLFSKWS